jgi:hypothetical protein
MSEKKDVCKKKACFNLSIAFGVCAHHFTDKQYEEYKEKSSAKHFTKTVENSTSAKAACFAANSKDYVWPYTTFDEQ